MTYELSLEDKIEAARAKLKTAFDRMMATCISSPALQTRIWLAQLRQAELKELLIAKETQHEHFELPAAPRSLRPDSRVIDSSSYFLQGIIKAV
jgi:hypothetical protein